MYSSLVCIRWGSVSERVRALHQKLYMETVFITDSTYHILGQIPRDIIYAEDTGISLAAKDGGIGPTNKVRDAILQKLTLDQLLAFRIVHLAELYFVVDRYCCENTVLHIVPLYNRYDRSPQICFIISFPSKICNGKTFMHDLSGLYILLMQAINSALQTVPPAHLPYL